MTEQFDLETLEKALTKKERGKKEKAQEPKKTKNATPVKTETQNAVSSSCPACHSKIGALGQLHHNGKSAHLYHIGCHEKVFGY